MKSVDHLIIGGGVAGTTAAETIRQNDKNCSIMIVSDEPHRFYSRILLSKLNFFFGKMPFDAIYLKKPEWYKDNQIELVVGRSAVSLNRSGHIIKLDDGTEIKYKKLLLAVGGHARRWNVPGAGKKGVCYLRNLDEVKEMMEDFKGAKRGITIGSGFVSFETLELMRKAGLDASVVMLEPYFWYPLFDEVSGRMIEKTMAKEGVNFVRNSEVAEVLGSDRVTGVRLKDGKTIDCEVIGVGIGLNYDLDWVKRAGIEVNRGIVACEHLETNDKDVFTAGDCAEFKDVILGERVQLGSWSNALNQGIAAAKNMLGQNLPFKLVSFYTAQSFGLNISMVGDVRVGDGKRVIDRGSEADNFYTKIIVKDGKIEGATMLNGTSDLFTICNLIEKNIDVTDKEKELSDPKFELKSLIK